MPLPYKCTTPPTSEPLTLLEAKNHLRVDFDDDDDIISDNVAEARERAEKHCSIGILPQQYTFALDRFPYGGYQDGAPSRSDYDMLGNLTWQGQIYHNRTSTIYLPVGPLISVDNITYLDVNGDQQTLDPSQYQIDTLSDDGPRILPAPNCTWPSTQYAMNAVIIKFTVGFVLSYTETYTVPAQAPYQVTIQNTDAFYQSASVVDGSGDAVAGVTESEGVYTFLEASAGASVTITYLAVAVPALIKRALKLLVSDAYNNRDDVVVGQGNVEKLPRGAESCLKSFRLYRFGYPGGR